MIARAVVCVRIDTSMDGYVCVRYEVFECVYTWIHTRMFVTSVTNRQFFFLNS